jgi:glycolate oxidase iron-sulfur subunit
LLRQLFGYVLPRPRVFHAALRAAQIGKVFAPLLPARLVAALALAPRRLPNSAPLVGPKRFAAEGQRKKRVALLAGCAQQVLAPEINAATIRLLTRHGCEVVIAEGVGCCGSLTHHLGQDATDFARKNIMAWSRELAGGGLDAIAINTSGCGTTIKDYGFIFRDDPVLAEPARKISELARDISEVMAEIGLQKPKIPGGRRVAYHSACSLQHGQRVRQQPKALLAQAGFVVLDPPEGHLCCGSAGTYNILQPEIAGKLRDRKVENIERVAPDIIAAGNIGCITQIASGTSLPVVHTAELLDWATGGLRPSGVADAS